MLGDSRDSKWIQDCLKAPLAHSDQGADMTRLKHSITRYGLTRVLTENSGSGEDLRVLMASVKNG